MKWLESRGALWAGLAFVWLVIVAVTLYPAAEMTRVIHAWTDFYYPGTMPFVQVQELWVFWVTWAEGMILAGLMIIGYGLLASERRDHVENKSPARLPSDTG